MSITNELPYFKAGNCVEQVTDISSLSYAVQLMSKFLGTDIGDLSDGYHTYNSLYHVRTMLFAVIVNLLKDKAWKTWKHEDGTWCFGKPNEWFLVSVDTPRGNFSFHCESKYWNYFQCQELPVAKHFDGHTEDDIGRLFSLIPGFNNPDVDK